MYQFRPLILLVLLVALFKLDLMSALVPVSLKRRHRNSQTKLDYAAEVYAGSATAMAGVIAFHEAGHFLAARAQGIKVESFNIGYGPKIYSFNDTNNVEFALRALPLGGYVLFPGSPKFIDEESGEIVEKIDDDPDLLENRPPLQRGLVISGGVLANILLSFLICTGVAGVVGQQAQVLAEGVVVSANVDPSSAGGQALLKKNDIITSIQSSKVTASKSNVKDFINVVRASPNVPLSLEVKRDNSIVNLQATPNSKGMLGISISANVKSSTLVKASNPIEAISMGWKETESIATIVGNGYKSVLQSGISAEQVGGPISIVKAGAGMADRGGSLGLVMFVATLSINLAILNSIPYPALDGGQLVFVVYELLAGKPPPKDIQTGITAIAFFGLLLLGSYSLVGDIFGIAK